MNSRKSYLGLLAAACVATTSTVTSADLANQVTLNFEDVSAVVGTPAGLTTWRFYVPFTSPLDNLLNVGFADFTSTGDFFQSGEPFGDDFPNLAFVAFDPTLAWDSWVTMDSDTMQGDTALDADFAWGADTLEGGWFDSNPGTPVLAGDDLQVLIMQLTLPQGATIVGEVTAFSDDGTDFQVYVLVPAPGGAVALLAPLFIRGRRRSA